MSIDIRQRLKALQYIDIKAKSKHQEIISLKSGILRSQQLNAEPRSTSKTNHSEELNLLIIDKTDKLYKEIEELYLERDEMVRAIESLEDPLENIVMRMLYIDSLSWRDIQRRLKCSSATIQRAKDKAIAKLIKKYDKNESK
nr:MAG TPA: Protein of unknown function (DUF1492) [Caudoviricetes sp.]